MRKVKSRAKKGKYIDNNTKKLKTRVNERLRSK